MGLRKTFLNQVKTIIGRKSSPTESPLQDNITPNSSPNHDPGPTIGNANDNSTLDASFGPPTIAMFNGLSNAHFHGGNFVQHNTISNSKRGLEILEKRVATAAFHNSAQRIDPPRCHPDTRVKILQTIYDWISKLDRRNEWIMWLNGAAGAGKSAIVQSTADRLAHVVAIAIASFFFFRADSTRNTMQPFVATLVYQLIQAIPETSNDILSIIERNPLVFDQSLESQLQQLIIQPLLRLPQHLKRLFVVFIDGLDECNDRNAQANLIRVLGNVSHGENTSVVFFVASRREPQIEAEFVRRPVENILQIVALDNSDVEQTAEDIRRFLVDKFHDIKKTHLLKRHLPPDWPATSVVEEIVAKSSGQFIFSSVVINYVSSPRANPAHQLEVVRGMRLRDPSSQNPFAHLDALYQHIFSQVESLGKVFDIVAFALLEPAHGFVDIRQVFLLEDGELDVLFADLVSVILCELRTEPSAKPKMRFLHASLPDFLLDKSRSEQYHLDLEEYRTKLLCTFLERPPSVSDPLWSADDLKHAIYREESRLYAIQTLLKEAKASERLRIAFMKFKPTFYTINSLRNLWIDICPRIFLFLKQLDFGDQGKAHHHVVSIFATGCAKYWPLLRKDVKDSINRASPDIGVQINDIQQGNISYNIHV